MNKLKKAGDDVYKKQFNLWDQNLKAAGVDSTEKLYTKVHAEIRANPARVKKTREAKPQKFLDKKKTQIETAKGKYSRLRKLTREERRKNVEKKIAIAQKAASKKQK